MNSKTLDERELAGASSAGLPRPTQEVKEMFSEEILVVDVTLFVIKVDRHWADAKLDQCVGRSPVI